MPYDDNVEKQLDIAGAGRGKKKVETGPVYRMIGDSKIPVSKQLGCVWQSRKDQGISARGKSQEAWDEAIRYYENDQMIHRDTSSDNASGNRPSRRLANDWKETENVVFSNCSIMVPMLYAKNPQISVTAANDAQADRARAGERLINVLLAKKEMPGLNMKPKLRRTVLVSLLTNAGFIKIGYTEKQDSTEFAIRELQQLSEKYASATKKKEIEELEGQLQALEEKVAMLSPSGPWVRGLMPHRVVTDPTSTQPDGSDANWMMEWDYLPTGYINAVYGKRQDEEVRSVYEPTHVISSGTDIKTIEDQVNSFTLLKDDATAANYGYENVAAFEAAKYTKVWYVWDKVTRRVLMFADNSWKWPLWVWDDPLKLPRFYPYFRLWFHEATNCQSPKGEVTYYLDQQDGINEINDEVRRGRSWVRRNVLFNKQTISQEDVERVLKGDDGTARGIDLPEGTKIQDHIFSYAPPGLDRPEFFSTDSKFAAINRITGVNDSMRGAQFKTNTTNKAVEAYQQNVDIRVDERTDLIEDFLGDICHNILMLCMMYWDTEDVAPLIGTELAQHWQKVNDPREFEKNFVVRVEGGSLEKPNSSTKKQQAIQLAQVLGQFANAAPATVVVMMKMIERSFDEVVIEDDEWAMIIQSMEMALTKAGSGPGGEEGGGQQGPPGPQQQTPQNDEQLMAQIRLRIAQLPPAAKQKLEEMVQAGMPPGEALKQIEAEIQQSPAQ